MKKLALFGGAVFCAALAGCADTPPTATPKNVIFFLGDGMGMTTMTAARIYKAGEDGSLTMDTLPETGFVKTYSNDSQVTDSAPSMSAYMTGVKMNNDVISMSTDTKAFASSGGVVTNYVTSAAETTCPANNGSPVPTLLELAKAAGFGTGVVTTARLTHATPAATYAHICHRDGEYDIARQAVPSGAGFNARLGDGVDVLLGGISTYWKPLNAVVPNKGRIDGRDLTAEMKAKGYAYVTNKTEFNAAVPTAVGYKLLGLFDQALAQGHMSYELDRDPAKEPSIAEMTAKAIDVLSKNSKGYFLMVEGGRIDHALHSTNAKRALADTVAFDDAIKVAMSKVDLTNTLIVVTADHDHTLVMNGYAQRTGPTTSSSAGVLGLVKDWVTGLATLDVSGFGYSILGFGNGESRPDTRTALTDAQTSDLEYHQEAVIKTSVGGETHGGTDVFIGAVGMGAEVFSGVMENTSVFGLVRQAVGL
jgi:alkaline phosphatase